MRIEGTHTFLAPIEHVYLALISPETLPQVLGGCERVIQLGPPTTEGTLAYDARLRSAEGVTNLHLAVTPLRAPEHLGMRARVHTRDGVVAADGTIDLVPQEDSTILAYTFEMTPPDAAPAQLHGTTEAAVRARYTTRARDLCGALAAYIRQAGEEGPTLPPGVGMVTPRGEIRIVPVETPAPLAIAARPAVVRAGWMAAGVLTGLGMIVLTLGLLRRMANHDE